MLEKGVAVYLNAGRLNELWIEGIVLNLVDRVIIRGRNDQISGFSLTGRLCPRPKMLHRANPVAKSARGNGIESCKLLHTGAQ
jgi:hypothetical protein